jgi:hypothetical protein
MRNTVGVVLALVGAAAAVLSPFRAWYDGRHGSNIRVQDLFTGITSVDADLPASVFLPLGFAAFVTVMAVILLSRPLLAASGLVMLGTAALWMARQSQTPEGLDTDRLGPGLANAIGGGALLLLAALIARGRRRARPAPARTPEGGRRPPPHHSQVDGYHFPQDPPWHPKDAA